MQRPVALVLSIIFFALFSIIAFYGAQVTIWSSIIFGLFVGLILLNIFYPPGQVATDQADFTLVLYAVFEILGVILLAIYITQKTLSDTWTCVPTCEI
jgi:uncharacterized membrane protein YagU involved in acid resistance